MSSKGVERIETAEGDEFDPNTQEAMTTVPAAEGKQPNTVANVWQVSSQRWRAMLLGADVYAEGTSLVSAHLCCMSAVRLCQALGCRRTLEMQAGGWCIRPGNKAQQSCWSCYIPVVISATTKVITTWS
jgi:hypothetical protein